MQSVLRRVAMLVSVVGGLSFAVVTIVGCGNVSPFAAAAFNSKLQGFGGINNPVNPQNNNNNGVTASVCDLPAAQQGLTVTLENESIQFVRFSMTFAVSAAGNGWVCDAKLQDYINAGYTDALVPGSGNTATVGCDTLTLLSGSRLLTMEFGINEGNSATLQPVPTPGGAATTHQLLRRDNNSPILPLPELIVFGNSNANFICSGGPTGNLCSQRGFVYSNSTGLPVGKAVEASRIQGTVCNTGFGTAPEWRLDKTVTDGTVAAFQYAAGGTIVATVLDRANDPLTETRNQVVWLVTDSNGATIHFPAP